MLGRLVSGLWGRVGFLEFMLIILSFVFVLLTFLVRKAVLGMMAVHRMQDGAHSAPAPDTDQKKQMKKELAAFKEESEKVRGDKLAYEVMKCLRFGENTGQRGSSFDRDYGLEGRDTWLLSR